MFDVFRGGWVEMKMNMDMDNKSEYEIKWIWENEYGWLPLANQSQTLSLSENPRESKCADDVEFWRVYSEIYQTLIDISVCIGQPSKLVSQVANFLK